jgi:prophage antirepressor-like protein
MDIIKAFNSNEMHTEVVIKGTYEEPLFRASDIGQILDVGNIRSTIQTFNSSEKVVHTMDTLGGSQDVTFLTEKGLYKVLFKSRKPIAEKFQDWVCTVVKEIRLNGKYELEQQLESAKQEITQIVETNKNEIHGKVAREREKMLINEFGMSGALVYVIKVKTNEDKSYIIKIGESRKGVRDRYNEHKTKYGDDILLLDCYAVKRSKEMESFILHHDKIRHSKVSNLPGHEKELELCLIGKSLSYNTVTQIINNNLKQFNEFSTEKLEEEIKMLRNVITNSNNSSTLKENDIIQELLNNQELRENQ